jgi:hypothetical protein
MTVSDNGVQSATFWDRTLDGCLDNEPSHNLLADILSLDLRI